MKYACPICQKTGSSALLFSEHLIKKHGDYFQDGDEYVDQGRLNNNTWICVCGKKYLSPDGFATHVTEHGRACLTQHAMRRLK